LNGSYFLGNGSSNAAFYAVDDPSGAQLTAKPNTSSYVLEVDRTITQNVLATLQYTGFTEFNGLIEISPDQWLRATPAQGAIGPY
jgi:hypothetical protein